MSSHTQIPSATQSLTQALQNIIGLRQRQQQIGIQQQNLQIAQQQAQAQNQQITEAQGRLRSERIGNTLSELQNRFFAGEDIDTIVEEYNASELPDLFKSGRMVNRGRIGNRQFLAFENEEISPLFADLDSPQQGFRPLFAPRITPTGFVLPERAKGLLTAKRVGQQQQRINAINDSLLELSALQNLDINIRDLPPTLQALLAVGSSSSFVKALGKPKPDTVREAIKGLQQEAISRNIGLPENARISVVGLATPISFRPPKEEGEEDIEKVTDKVPGLETPADIIPKFPVAGFDRPLTEEDKEFLRGKEFTEEQINDLDKKIKQGLRKKK